MRPAFAIEHLIDFTNEVNKNKMLKALDDVSGKLGRDYPLIIGGDRVFTDNKIVSLDPCHNTEVVGRVSKASKEHLDRAIAAAARAFESWKKADLQARAAVLFKAASIIRKRRFELNAWVIREIGRNWLEADADVAEAVDFLEYYGRAIVHIQENQHILPVAENEDNRMTYIPLGVGSIISPWNFPVALITGMTSAGIVAGNTVLVKPSSLTPVVASLLADIWEEAGLPAGVVNFVPGDGSEIGDDLVSHPQMRFINFTGSRETGERINRLAAQTSEGQIWLKRVVLEMGGKDAILVDEDVFDLDDVADGIVNSAFGFQGQKCSACSRAIIHEKIYDELTAKIVERTKKLRVGSATEDFFIGPVADDKSHKKILDYIEIGKKEGTLLCGGEAGSEDGYYIIPTVFGDIKPKDRLAQEEIFGPVLALVKAKNFEDGIEIFNNTEYGLTGAFYGRNRENIEIARDELHCGNLYLNRKCTAALVGAHPFGGFNMSGTDSKTGSSDYLLLFTQAKMVTEAF